MKYAAFLGIWIACYFLPAMAGEWYDTFFHFNQSAISLILIYAADRLCSGWWVPEYKCLAALHILHNVGDAYLDFPYDNYLHLQGIINTLELSLIIIGPASIVAYRTWQNGRNSNRNDSGRGPAAFAARSEDAR